jgi:hypothetical protein
MSYLRLNYILWKSSLRLVIRENEKKEPAYITEYQYQSKLGQKPSSTPPHVPCVTLLPFLFNFSNYQTGDTVMSQQDCNVFIFPLLSFARPQQPICENGHCYHTFFGFVCSSLLESMPGPRQVENKEILIFLFFKIHFVDRLTVNRFVCVRCVFLRRVTPHSCLTVDGR